MTKPVRGVPGRRKISTPVKNPEERKWKDVVNCPRPCRFEKDPETQTEVLVVRDVQKKDEVTGEEGEDNRGGEGP